MAFILDVDMFSHPHYWLDISGQLIEICNMNDRYLNNTIGFIRKRYARKSDAAIIKLSPQFKTMLNEFSLRNEISTMKYKPDLLSERNW